MESLIKKFADLGAKQEELEKELEKVKDERFELKLKLMEIGYAFQESAIQIKYVDAYELEGYIKVLKEAIDLVKNNQKEDESK